MFLSKNVTNRNCICDNWTNGCKKYVSHEKIISHYQICPFHACKNNKFGCKKFGNVFEVSAHQAKCSYYICNNFGRGCRTRDTIEEIINHQIDCPYDIDYYTKNMKKLYDQQKNDDIVELICSAR